MIAINTESQPKEHTGVLRRRNGALTQLPRSWPTRKEGSDEV